MMGRPVVISILLCLFVVLSLAPAWAGENNSLELTLEDAVNRALIHSKSLEISELEVDKSEEAMDDASYALARFSPTWETDYVPGVEPLFVAREQSKYGYEVAKKKLAATKDSVILAVHQAYYNVLKKEAQVSLAQITLKRDELKLKNALVSYDYGIISKQALMGAQAAVTSSKASLEAAQLELENAYKGLNVIIGLPEDSRPKLINNITFTPFSGDLNVQVSLAMDENPSVVAAVENARLTKELEGWDEDISTEDIKMAELKASMARDQIKEALRTLYTNVKNMEESYPAAQEAVRLAQEDLRVTQLKFEAGMATKSEILEAERNLLDAQQKLLQLTLDHAYYKLSLEKPWAL
ncbi:MAG: outer membrane protein [Moorella sp. (in: firmicutes)]|nr:outer membrane protein [Moorella sp. (in: firmicutes)]